MSSDTSARRPGDPSVQQEVQQDPGVSVQQPVRGQAPADLPVRDPAPESQSMTGPSGTPLGGEVQEPRREPEPAAPLIADAPPTRISEPQSNQPMMRTATVSSPGRIAFGVAVLVLGVLLGISDQQADNTDMVLRVPALIAALIMVAQGMQLILRGLPRETEVEVIEVVDDTDPRNEVRSVRPRLPMASMAAFRSDPATLGLPTLVIVLAVWLGLADLRVDSPDVFGGLSMLSAFVLFALGWTLLPARK